MRTRHYALLLLLCVATLTAGAQDDNSYFDDTGMPQGSAYLEHLDRILEIFSEAYPTYLPEKYLVSDIVSKGEKLSNCLCLSTYDENRQMILHVDGQVLNPVSASIPDGDPYRWNNIANMGKWTPATDVTTRFRPLFARANQAGNRYSAYHEFGINDAAARDRMIFKQHVGNVRFVDYYADSDGHLYTYALADAAQAKKMFRGYEDGELAPMLVHHDYLDTHTPQQFSRWKFGEPVEQLSAGKHDHYLRQIRDRYHGRNIRKSQWLASFEQTEYWLVIFDDQPDNALASIIAFKDGNLKSAYDEFARLSDDDDRLEDGRRETVWDLGDEGEYAFPEIMAITHNSELNTTELSIRQLGVESNWYFILREAGPVMTMIYYQPDPISIE